MKTIDYMGLSDTIGLMVSVDYADRLKAEYMQATYRLMKLKKMLKDWADGVLRFEPKCDRALYENQVKAMEKYVEALGERAYAEGIILNTVYRGE